MKEMSSTRIATRAGLRRRIAILLSAVLSAALILSGTYAWYASENEVNKFSQKGADRYVILHDDFKGGPEKLVYVENTGTAADVYVRIKLQEYMDLTSWTDRDIKPSEWLTHIPGASPDTSSTVSPGLEPFHENFHWSMGGSAWYVPSVEKNGVENNPGVDKDTPGAKKTLTADVILMADYKDLTAEQRKQFVGWVYDADGWAYWSQPLKAKTATGLLLNAVTADVSLKDNDYFYAINVIMEAVDKNDLAMWMVPSGAHDGYGKPSIVDPSKKALLATNSAIIMLADISDTDIQISAFIVKKDPDKMIYKAGDTFNPEGMILEVVFLDGTIEDIDAGFTYNPYGGLSEGENVEIVITYNKFQVSLYVTVEAAEIDDPEEN